LPLGFLQIDEVHLSPSRFSHKKLRNFGRAVVLAFDERVRRRDLVEMTRKPESSQPRKGMPAPRLGVDEFKRRFLDQSQDPAFSSLQAELSKMADAAGDGYLHSRKSPNTRKVGDTPIPGLLARA
jgi:hypothetical protein